MLLNQIQDGTSFGAKEMSAKNSNVPTKSRTRAKTSFQALFLSVRATASDSNLKAASFNPVVAALACSLTLAHALARDRDGTIRRARRSRPTVGLSSLRATQETDN